MSGIGRVIRWSCPAVACAILLACSAARAEPFKEIIIKPDEVAPYTIDWSPPQLAFSLVGNPYGCAWMYYVAPPETLKFTYAALLGALFNSRYLRITIDEGQIDRCRSVTVVAVQ
jgi:hypothetical protein